MKKTLLALGLLTSLPLAAADVNIAYAADFTSLDPMERLSDRNLQMAHLLFAMTPPTASSCIKT